MAPKAAAEYSEESRTQISKKISWVLRKGARALNIEINDKGWMKIADLRKYSDLAEVDEATLVQVINDSNVAKLRYEVSKDGQKVRAYEKKERQATSHDQVDPLAQMQVMQMQLAHMQMTYPFGFPYPPMMNPMMSAMMGGMQAAAAATAAGRYSGRIKSFNPDKGFGFIECAETYALYNRDVFLHRAQINDMQVGAFVTFACETNNQGMPQAKGVLPYGMAPPPSSHGKGKTSGKGKSKGKGKGTDKGEKVKGKGEGKSRKNKDKKEEAEGSAVKEDHVKDDGDAKKEESTS